MNTLILRIGLLLFHIFLNVVIIAYLTRYDVAGSWMATAGFVLLLFVLLAFFIIHLLSFIRFYKHK
jgi:hypothetical protein